MEVMCYCPPPECFWQSIFIFLVYNIANKSFCHCLCVKSFAMEVFSRAPKSTDSCQTFLYATFWHTFHGEVGAKAKLRWGWSCPFNSPSHPPQIFPSVSSFPFGGSWQPGDRLPEANSCSGLLGFKFESMTGQVDGTLLKSTVPIPGTLLSLSAARGVGLSLIGCVILNSSPLWAKWGLDYMLSRMSCNVCIL